MVREQGTQAGLVTPQGCSNLPSCIVPMGWGKWDQPMWDASPSTLKKQLLLLREHAGLDWSRQGM